MELTQRKKKIKRLIYLKGDWETFISEPIFAFPGGSQMEKSERKDRKFICRNNGWKFL